MGINSADSQSAETIECSGQDTTFELRTGYVFTAPEEILDTRPDTLQLADCIETCRLNSSCSALNFETGLCVLFRTNAFDTPGKPFLSYFLLLLLLPSNGNHPLGLLIARKRYSKEEEEENKLSIRDLVGGWCQGSFLLLLLVAGCSPMIQESSRARPYLSCSSTDSTVTRRLPASSPLLSF